jgi:hypothetical protein
VSAEEEAAIPPPDFWRARADEARAMAHRFDDPIARTLMLDIANKYDHMTACAARCRGTRSHD